MFARLLLVSCLLIVGTPAPAHAEPDVYDLQAITKPGQLDPAHPDQVILYLKIRNNGPGVAGTGQWSWEIKLPSGTQSNRGCTIYEPGKHFACKGDGFHYPVGSPLASDDWWVLRVKVVSRPFGNDGFFKLIYSNDPNHANDVAPLTIAAPTSARPTPNKAKPTPISPSSPAVASTSPAASASASASEPLSPKPTATESAATQAPAVGNDGGSPLTTVGVATVGTAVVAGLGLLVMRRRRGTTKELS